MIKQFEYEHSRKQTHRIHDHVYTIVNHRVRELVVVGNHQFIIPGTGGEESLTYELVDCARFQHYDKPLPIPIHTINKCHDEVFSTRQELVTWLLEEAEDDVQDV